MNIDNKVYRKHPRMLELRFLMIHTNFVMEFGLENTAIIFKGISESARINWSILSSVIARKDLVLELNRTNRLRFRQELMFMGEVFEETRVNTMKRYLRISKRLMYESFGGMLLPNNFLNQEWLDQLDYTVKIAGNTAYAYELERFINHLSIMSEVISGVPMAKV